MQFRDLRMQYSVLKKDIDFAIEQVIGNSAFILGKEVGEIEEKLAAFVGRDYCVSCGNGTDALWLALKVMDIGPGDAVFTTDFTYFASAGCISLVGATPIFVDIDKRTFNISPQDLEKKVKKVYNEGKLSPKAIIPVDLYGLPADYRALLEIAHKYDLRILEDAAQGFGGDIDGKRACSFGDISITSFFPAKPLGCYGDGGAIFTDDIAIAERLRSLRTNGRSPDDKYDNREIGINSRLDTIQAAILLPKFKAFVDYELDAVNNVAKIYSAMLKDRFAVPFIPDGFRSSWAQYTIMLSDEKERSEVQKKLKVHDIPSMIYYPRGLHQQEAYKSMGLCDEEFPNTVEASRRVLSLPMHPYLTNDMIEEIVDIITR